MRLHPLACAAADGCVYASRASRERQSLANIRAVGFDKTGTLTTGAFELLRFDALPGAAHTREALHRWVAAVEELDNHPIARSLVASYKGCVADFAASGESLPEPADYQRHGRDGVSGMVEGRRVGIGNIAFLRASLSKNQAGKQQNEEDEEDEEDPDMPPRLRAALKKKREKERAEMKAVISGM